MTDLIGGVSYLWAKTGAFGSALVLGFALLSLIVIGDGLRLAGRWLRQQWRLRSCRRATRKRLRQIHAEAQTVYRRGGL